MKPVIRSVIFLSVMGLISIALLIYFQFNTRNSYYKLKVSGIVTNITRGERDYPKISIDNRLIDFGSVGFTIVKEINVGDSVVKAEGNRLIVYKFSALGVSSDTIVFN